MKWFACVLTIVAIVGLAVNAAQAALVVGEQQWNSGDVLPDPIVAVSGDLLETSVASVSGENSSAYVRNGTTGTAQENTASVNPAAIWAQGTTTYNLDVSTNTRGYDISAIRLFSGWDGYRAGQYYDINYRKVGSSSFVNLGTVSAGKDSAGSLLTNTYHSSSNVILTGVDAIQFVDHSNESGFDAGTVFREFDVVGTARSVVGPTVNYETRYNDPASDAGASWSQFTSVPNLSSSDYLHGLTNPFTAIAGSAVHSASAPLNTTGMAVLNDGAGSTTNDQTIIVADGAGSYVGLLIDLQAPSGKSVYVEQFNSYGMISTDGTRGYQKYVLYGSNADTAPTTNGDFLSEGWAQIASVDQTLTAASGTYATTAVSIDDINTNYRYLLFYATTKQIGDGTAYSGNHYVELDVVGTVIPEPGTSIMLATGLVALLAYAWRKKK